MPANTFGYEESFSQDFQAIVTALDTPNDKEVLLLLLDMLSLLGNEATIAETKIVKKLALQGNLTLAKHYVIQLLFWNREKFATPVLNLFANAKAIVDDTREKPNAIRPFVSELILALHQKEPEIQWASTLRVVVESSKYCH